MTDTRSTQVPKGSRVRIRMYRQGIGDCFLLTFFVGKESRHILIDCGVLSGTPRGKEKILQVAENIKETAGDLQILVATHEHWDHVSGFYYAKEIFDPMKMGEIWVAWTEDPNNPEAKELKRQNKFKLQAVHGALAQLANSGDTQLRAYGQGVSELLGFFGGPQEGATLAAFSEKTGQAMDAVTKRSPAPTYLKPGDLIQRDWLPGVRVYVLGPPQDRAMLRKLQGRAGKEIYGLAGADSAFAAALEAMMFKDLDKPVDPGRADLFDANFPFNSMLQWRDENKIQNDPTFGPLYQEYRGKEKFAWRRIDHDWLMSMARLGLQLDSATNNTSLVLAFEFVETGEVFLFPGDAQIGSWKSWATLKWKNKDKDGGVKEVVATDLLGRTVFYKVGHHGSHNATMKEGGLEAMTSPGLVAAIPVNQDFANNSKHWEMPAEALFNRLKELTRGRILRADAAWPTTDDQCPQGLSRKEWQRFTKSINLDPEGLFIDYYL